MKRQDTNHQQFRKQDDTQRDKTTDKGDKRHDADAEEKIPVANYKQHTRGAKQHKNFKSKRGSRSRPNFEGQKFPSRSGASADIGQKQSNFPHPSSNAEDQRSASGFPRHHQQATGELLDLSEGYIPFSAFTFEMKEDLHLVFPDAEETSSEAHALIKIIYPKDYHRYPERAPLKPKDGPYTERNKDKKAPGLVESTVEDTTPRDEKGRFVTPPYPVNYTCGWCGRSSLMMLACAGCRRARYCDMACHENHWAWHKQSCFNDPENATDAHVGETLEVEIFMDSEDELRYEPEEVKEKYRERKKKEQEESERLMVESDKEGQ